MLKYILYADLIVKARDSDSGDVETKDDNFMQNIDTKSSKCERMEFPVVTFEKKTCEK